MAVQILSLPRMAERMPIMNNPIKNIMTINAMTFVLT
jgi:hypothetical protein